jgi:hypothetical protein
VYNVLYCVVLSSSDDKNRRKECYFVYTEEGEGVGIEEVLVSTY